MKDTEDPQKERSMSMLGSSPSLLLWLLLTHHPSTEPEKGRWLGAGGKSQCESVKENEYQQATDLPSEAVLRGVE